MMPNQDYKLHHVSLLLNQGFSSPLFDLSTDPFFENWQKGPRTHGMLTEKGKSTIYDLGMAYKALYFEELDVISQDFDNDDISIMAVGNERGVMSGQSFMQGFYPLNDSSPLDSRVIVTPILSSSPSDDCVLMPYYSCNSAQKNFESIQLTEEWLEMEQREGSFLQSISNIFSVSPPISLATINQIYNPISSDIDEFGKMEVLDTLGLSDEDWDRLSSDYRFVVQQMYPISNPMAQLLGSQGLKRILADIDGFISGKDVSKDFSKMHFYFGNPESFLSLFSVLGVRDISTPVPASLLEFNLFKLVESSSEEFDEEYMDIVSRTKGTDPDDGWVVTVVYNGYYLTTGSIDDFANNACVDADTIVERSKPSNCPGADGILSPGNYSLTLFRLFVDSLPNESEWRSLCSSDSAPIPLRDIPTEMTWWACMLITVAVLAVIIGGIVFISRWVHSSNRRQVIQKEYTSIADDKSIVTV
ncbi:Histidine phosphatase superfamily, clade-2 like protein [Aduncisulcus paluster]|uniref:Histidine phosphatase superfamily, clade-2 like protein n=1 Tax=Aduncisulcus paluster TaxID=2918883 RepID=A0ABQ5K332_9EUKA|nr:Histidine phosphatase superfamily, clade-2 like protein [Aduncisulcus paluster]